MGQAMMCRSLKSCRWCGTLVLALAFAMSSLCGAATTGISPLITNLEFSAGPAQLGVPGGVPIGQPGSAVDFEQTVAPAPPVAPDSADDDIYSAVLGFPLAFSNIKIVDDGYPLVATYGAGIGPLPGVPPPPQCTIPTDQENVNALATDGVVAFPPSAEDVRFDLLSGALFVQFSVDNASLGLALTGVNQEATFPTPEQPGDVYESLPMTPIGTNVVIADEDASGLALPSTPLQDDLDALILEQSIGDALSVEDTDGVGGPDTPTFYFSCDKAFVGTGGPISPGDILAPGPVGLQPFPIIPAAVIGLVPGPGGDDIDALYVAGLGGGILFSLSAGSPTLGTAINLPLMGVGADPGDILYANPGAGVAPTVVLLANEIGLRGDQIAGAGAADDELNALWVWPTSLAGPLEWIPVELSVFTVD